MRIMNSISIFLYFLLFYLNDGWEAFAPLLIFINGWVYHMYRPHCFYTRSWDMLCNLIIAVLANAMSNDQPRTFILCILAIILWRVSWFMHPTHEALGELIHSIGVHGVMALMAIKYFKYRDKNKLK